MPCGLRCQSLIRVPAVRNAKYYRQLAEVCRRLALGCSEAVVAERFRLMALDLMAKAEEMKQSDADDILDLLDLHVIGRDDPSGNIDLD